MTRLLLLVLVVGLSGCATPRPPVLPALRERADKPVVVFLPGITGTQLRDRQTGKLLWGHTLGFFLPRDGGYALARPLAANGCEPDRLEPFAPIMEVRLFGLWKAFEAYGSIVRLMQQNGYRYGTDFFFFLYDWRQDNVCAARALARQLEQLRARRGGQPLKVVLICQSNAAHIGRYFVKYGGASLEQAEAGGNGPPPGIDVEKLILIGTSNGGALRTLREINRGRTYVPLLGRQWLPETLFTFGSLYQDLPVYRTDLFFDAEGSTLAVDLFDPWQWQQYGWSVFAPPVRARLQRLNKFGDEPDRMRFLQQSLRNAQRFHRLLQHDPPGFRPPRYYSVQNLYAPTPERAMLLRRRERWETLFWYDGRLNRDRYLLSLAVSPGDGHATLESQQWLSPQERAAFARPPVYVAGGHFNIVLNPATQRRLLEFLAD